MGPEHAQSICSFSGLNDHHPPETDTDQVQSYGQIIRGKFIPPGYNSGGAAIPGEECNGHLNPPPWHE